MIDYEYFLSRRFDLVIRYHLLRESDFEAKKAALLVSGNEYKELREISGVLLKRDMKSKEGIAKKVERQHYNGPLGDLVAIRFFDLHHWIWVEDQMKRGQKWINENPYEMRVDVLGLSVKRFLLALTYERILPWVFKTQGKTLLELWKKQNYEELSEFDNIQKSQDIMMMNMKKLEYFSLDTYKGEEVLLEEYKRHLQT